MIDPRQRIDGILNIRIRDGVIAELGQDLPREDSEEILDASGAYVAPGFIDMHVHLREPGNPEKETIATGTTAALAGGFTAVACMPNTDPAIDTPELVHWIKETAWKAGLARVYPIAAITRGRAGREPIDYLALSEAGAVAFSDDGTSIESAIVQTNAALRARDSGRRFITHCEPENATVARDIAIACVTEMPWHVAHVSTAEAVSAIEAGKRLGLALTCEATPHHLVFTRADAAESAADSKVNPPLREPGDVAALRDAVRNGTIDALASDHAPHADGASPGFTGLEIAVGAYAYALGDLPIGRFVELLSCNPARILGVAGGTLAIGSPADLTIVADREWIVDPARFHSKGKRTPFAGMKLPRRAVATIVGGSLLMRDGRLTAQTAR